jgi:hypothetical protein
LITAVAEILRVDQSSNAELSCEGDGVVVTCVINQNYAVDDLFGDLSMNPLKCTSRSVSGQNHDDPFAVHHGQLFYLRRHAPPNVVPAGQYLHQDELGNL